jgi:hypothetical protein
VRWGLRLSSVPGGRSLRALMVFFVWRRRQPRIPHCVRDENVVERRRQPFRSASVFVDQPAWALASS